MNRKKSELTDSEIVERLTRANISPTAQRIAICRYVLSQSEHPTAEDIKEWVDKNFPKMSMATVYNTLGVLVKAGLVKEIRLPHMESAVYDTNLSQHFHFVDEDSGEVLDIEPEKVRISEELKKQFQIREIEVILRGSRKK